MSEAVLTTTTRIISDGEPHPLTERLAERMMERLTAMFKERSVAVFEYKTRSRPPFGWHLASDTIVVSARDGQVTIGGKSCINGRFYDVFAFELDGRTSYTIVAGRSVTFCEETGNSTTFIPFLRSPHAE